MRPADRLDAFGAGMVVEHDAATAIHLQVDEAGRQHIAGLDDLRAGRNLVPRDDSFYRVTAKDERGILMPAFAVEDLLGEEGKHVAHIVSVTLRRCGGWSGFSPRCRAKASTKA